MLKEGGAMFLFRSSHSMFTLGNAFVLGLFAPAQAVGYYAGAEKINAAAVGLLSPLSTALYPRTASMAKIDLVKAARLTRISLLVMTSVSLVLGLAMWLSGPLSAASPWDRSSGRLARCCKFWRYERRWWHGPT